MAPRSAATRTTSAKLDDLIVVSPSGSQSPSVAGDEGGPAAGGSGAGTSGQEAEEKPDSKAIAAAKRKKSQRPSWSCTECTRRKIRCNKIIPGCDQCIRRGKVHLCRLENEEGDVTGGAAAAAGTAAIIASGSNEAVVATGSSSATTTATSQPRLDHPQYTAISASVSALRMRLHHLEQVLGAFIPQPGQVGPDGGPLYAFPTNFSASSVASGSQQQLQAQPRPPHVDSIAQATPERGHAESYGWGNVASGGANASTYAIPNAIERIRDAGHIAESDGEVEAAVTLEFLALGRDRKQDHANRSELRRPEEDDDSDTSPRLDHAHLPSQWPTDPTSSALFSLDPHNAIPSYPIARQADSIAEMLPTREQSDAIVRWALERVNWQHGAVHTGSFLAQCAEFHSWGEESIKNVNQTWLALYLAVMCVGIKHMTEADAAACGLTMEDLLVRPKEFFDASIEALHRGQFLAKHSIFSVQAIVILVVSCQDVGGSDLIATLLACAIRIAQHLNIHRFSSDADWEARRRQNGIEPFSDEGIKGLIDREVRKRLWCALSTEDWLSTTFRRSYAIFPSHCTTPLPTNCHDDDLSAGRLIARSNEEPNCATKLILSFKVASCIRRFFEDLNTTGSPSYDLCLAMDREIRDIMSSAPKYLRGEADFSQFPPFVPFMSQHWVMSVSHKLLVIHRVFLGRSFRDPRYSFSRQAAIEASRTIIHQLSRGTSRRKPVWTVAYHTVVASTTLVLDIFQCDPTNPQDDVVNKRREVQNALDELQILAAESPIAERGVKLLTTLLAEETKHRRPTQNALKRKASEVDRFGDVAKRIAKAPRASGSSSHSVTSNPSPTLSSTTFPFYLPTDSPSDGGALTQDAFDSILLEGIGSHMYGNNVPGTGDAGVEFWRMLDATFEPGQGQELDPLGGLGGGMGASGDLFGLGGWA